MSTRERHPGIQHIIFNLFVAGQSLYTLFVVLSSGMREMISRIELIAAAAVILIAFAITVFAKITDRAHALVLNALSIVLMLLFSFLTREPLYLNYGVCICTLLICIYENPSVLRIETLCTILVYLISGLVYGLGFHAPAGIVLRFVWTAFFILMMQMVLLYLVGHIYRYKRVNEENSKSSQDMLRVVEMKRKEANHAVEAKSAFLSNMSHEIRTPINAILGMDEIILRDSNEENIIEYAGKIQNAGDTLLSLVNDILDFSKIESGRMEIVPEEYRTENLFNDAYDMIYLRTEAKGLQLYFDINPRLPSVLFGDMLRVKQVLVNVLNNAVKYTEKGSVRITADFDTVAEKQIRVLIKVADTGIGIRKENLDLIFGAFERVDVAKTKNIEGTGLGMSIAKDLLSMMDGDIRVESEYGEGSTFYISFAQMVIDEKGIGEFHPRNTTLNPKEFRRRAFSAPDARVLVVDDNEMNLLVVKGYLKNIRAQIDLAMSGRECLSMVTEKHYDIIFMDHMMPDLDGIETFERMKTLEGNLCKDTPVIALTANAVVGARELYLKAGFHGYLAKPIHSRQLEEVLLQFLSEDMIQPEEMMVVAAEETLPQLEGIHFAEGLSYASGDLEQYHISMNVFLRSAAVKRQLIEKTIKEKDWGRFTVEVHSLKSNSRYLGAAKLGDLFYQMEQAGKTGDERFIEEHFREVTQEWDRVLQSIEKYIRPKAQEEVISKQLPIDDTIYRKKVAKIIQALQNFEIDDAMGRLHDLLDYDLPPEQLQLTKAALDAADNFEYEKAEEILQEGSLA